MARVAVLGGGLIGCGWAAAFAGAGHEVVVVDPDPATADRLADTWTKAQPAMLALETLAEQTQAPRHESSADALASVELVQEALPENLALKHRALGEIEGIIPAHVPIASSSSGFTPQMIAQGMEFPERLFIAHPCNPPYLMPTVELIGQEITPASALDAAQALYEGMGKTVLRMAKPMQGHLVNRLQFALWREAVNLVASGAATLPDVERAVTEGLAPRWCLMGPAGVFHLSGGARGMEGYLDALGPATSAMWDDLGAPDLAKAADALIAGMAQSDPRPVAEIGQARDEALPRVLRALKPIKSNYHQKGGTT
ncbi:3-hydroxyacyl-CoA dehydrogenase NAD-binding domain-containing protein [Rhodobacteraceae bacterium D3-12]|nr:3-hydroxyacyl-CoA dehydrogenase NAD-binding domain-containing protein [Rhodobacteraceae bacterium D3-12]